MTIHLPRAFSSRRAIIIGSLFIALLGAIGLAGSSSESGKVWAASHDIQSGERVTQSDLHLVSVSLGDSDGHYLTSKETFTARTAARGILRGELVPVTALNGKVRSANNRQLPLGVQISDLPEDLSVGDVIDVYVVPHDSHVQSEKVGASLLVTAVDTRSRNLGGVENIVVAIKEPDIVYLTDAIGLGRLVVVRHA